MVEYGEMSWVEKLKGAATQLKDSGASAAIRAWLSRELAEYGEVLDFKLNSRERGAELHVLLKGEAHPLTIHVEEYELIESGGENFVRVIRARASREWANSVLKNFVIGQRHPIPKQYSGVVKLVLNG
jgi:hypothetical protein